MSGIVDMFLGGSLMGQNYIAGLRLDALMSEAFDLNSEVTEYPVEDDSPVHDSIIPMSPKLNMNAVVTNANVVLLGSLLSGTSASGSGKLLAASRILLNVWKTRAPVSISSELTQYVNYAMTRCKMTRNGEGEDGYLTIDASFIKIRTVKLQATTVTVTNAAPSVAGKAGATASAGQAVTGSAAPTPAASTVTQGQSLLSKLLSFGS